MATFFIAFFVLALIMAGMAIGAILQNKPLQGSCGGLSAVGLDGDCEICGGDRNKCEEETKKVKSFDASLVVDATKK